MRCLDAITDLMDVNWSKLWKMLRDRGAWCAEVLGVKTVRHDLAAAQLHLHLGPSQAEALFLGGEGPFLIQIHTVRKETHAEPKTAQVLLNGQRMEKQGLISKINFSTPLGLGHHVYMEGQGKREAKNRAVTRPGLGQQAFSVLEGSLAAVAMATIHCPGAGGCAVRYLCCFKAQKSVVACYSSNEKLIGAH